MKRKFLICCALVTVFLVGSLVGFTGISTVEAQVEADSDYQVCMDYCMPEHNFDYCHEKCKEVAIE